MQKENKPKLLLVDDDAYICEIMQRRLERKNYQVFVAASGKEALSIAKEESPQIMLLDKRMPEMDGIEILKAIRRFNAEIKVIMVSADELDPQTEKEIEPLNIFAYLHKPVSTTDLDLTIEKASL